MRLRLPLLALLLLLAACKGGETTSSDATPPPDRSAAPRPTPKPASPAELALVAPLAPGGDLGGYTVREVQAVMDGVLVVIVNKDRDAVRLWIALAAEKGPEPPAKAGKYAIYYGTRGKADPQEADRLARALAEIVEKHPDVPVPPGMTSFVPTPIPL